MNVYLVIMLIYIPFFTNITVVFTRSFETFDPTEAPTNATAASTSLQRPPSAAQAALDMTDEDESTKVDMADPSVGVVEGSGRGSGGGEGEGMVMTEFLVSTGLDQSIHMVR